MPVSLLSEVSTVIRSTFTRHRNARHGFNAPQFGEKFVLAMTSDRRGLVYLNSATHVVSVSESIFDSYTWYLQTLRSSNEGILFARNFNEIWFTAGTPESTRQVTQLPGAAVQSNTVTIGQDTWFFIFDRNASPGNWALVRTDGTSIGTTRLLDFPETKSIVQFDNLSAVGGKLLFGLQDIVTGASEIWVSDGTLEGTTAISDDLILRQSSRPAFVAYDHGIAFAAATPETGFEPFRIDTTVQVTPPGGVSADSNGSHLTWLDMRGAIQYDVWITSLNDPAMPVHVQRVNAPEYAVPNEFPDGAYRVWTRSYPVLGAPSAWNTATDFVKGTNPAIHSLPAFSVQNRPLIEWTGPADVVSYEFWLTNRDTKTRVLYLTELQGTSRQIDQPLDPAKYAVWVRGTRADQSTTDWSELTEFEVLAPPVMITAGTGNQRSARPAFSWQAVAGATGYDIRILAAGSTTPVYHADNVQGSMHQVMRDLAGGEYRVFVRALRGTRTLSAWGAGDVLRIYLPPTGLQATERGISWNAAPLAASYTFELRNSRNQLAMPITTMTGTSFQFNPTLAPGKYTVRIYSNFSRLSSAWSPVVAFEVFHPRVTIASSGAPTADATPTVTWTVSPGAASYEVFATGSGDSPATYRRTGIQGTSHRVERPLPTGMNQIWVRAHYADGSRSVWSSALRIVIGPPPVVTVSGSRISWNPVNAATHYEILIDRLLPSQAPEIVREPQILEAQYTLSSTLARGRYQAKVRAVRAEEGLLYLGDWSVPALIDLL